MRIKSVCLVCRGAGKKLGEPCLGCRGYGWLFVSYIPKGPMPELDADPEVNRRALRIRAKSPGLLEKIVAAVKEFQSAYLESKDILHLKPMRLQDIASAVPCDMITVHLYLRDEHIDGVEVKSLFSRSVCGVSSKAIRHMIMLHIQKEESPLSDNDIREYLITKGITVSRRTVTKYRMQIKVPSHFKRKSEVV